MLHINLVKEQKNTSNREADFSKDRKWLETECDRPLNDRYKALMEIRCLIRMVFKAVKWLPISTHHAVTKLVNVQWCGHWYCQTSLYRLHCSKCQLLANRVFLEKKRKTRLTHYLFTASRNSGISNRENVCWFMIQRQNWNYADGGHWELF